MKEKEIRRKREKLDKWKNSIRCPVSKRECLDGKCPDKEKCEEIRDELGLNKF